MKNHSRGRGKRGVGYRTPSMFKAGAQLKAIGQRQMNGIMNKPAQKFESKPVGNK